MAAYHDAIAVVVRSGAPLATYSIDRRCLGNYRQCFSNGGPEPLICVCCDRRFPYAAAWARHEIRWIRPLGAPRPGSIEQGEEGAAREERFCGLDRERTAEVSGLDTYLKRYGRCAGASPDLTLPAPMNEFSEWKLRVEFSEQELGIM